MCVRANRMRFALDDLPDSGFTYSVLEFRCPTCTPGPGYHAVVYHGRQLTYLDLYSVLILLSLRIGDFGLSGEPHNH